MLGEMEEVGTEGHFCVRTGNALRKAVIPLAGYGQIRPTCYPQGATRKVEWLPQGTETDEELSNPTP